MSDEHVLYGHQGSGSAAIEAALELAGLRYRIVQAASWDEHSAREALAQVNLLGQIPVLQWPDGSAIGESAAILIELGLRHPASGLLPTAPAERARALRGLVYLAANCYAAIGIVDYPERWVAPADGSVEPTIAERVRAGTRARLHALWEMFADQHPAAPFLGGERLGALDLLAAVISRWSGARAHLKAVRPQWAAVLERIDTHPAVGAVFARHWP